LLAIVAVLVAIPAAADTGTFQSFSTNVTPQVGTLAFDLSLVTSGATTGTMSTSDQVYLALFLGRVDRTYVTCFTGCAYPLVTQYDYTTAYRGSAVGRTFAASFSFSVAPDVAYKWGSVALYSTGSPDIYSTTTYDVVRFYYFTFYPFIYGPTITDGSLLVNRTDTVSPNIGQLNVWIQLGRIPVGNPIPVLGTWGLLILGAVLAATGVVILRRLS
jgi:hypothetical protein